MSGNVLSDQEPSWADRARNSLPQEQFAALQRDLVAEPRWIIAGNLPTRLQAANTVYFRTLLLGSACSESLPARSLRAAGSTTRSAC